MRFGARKPEFQVCTPHFTFLAAPQKEKSQKLFAFPLGKSQMNYSCSRYELKCNECGAMNYPTEWYCERCGAELAAL